MSTPIATNDVIRLVVYTYQASMVQLGINVHYLKCSVAILAPTLENQVQSFSNQLQAVIQPLLASSAQYMGCTIQKWMPPLPLGLPVQSLTAGVNGTAAGDILPGNITGIIRWKTDFAGRKYRGRSYIPFPAEGDNGANGLPTGAYLVRATAYAGLFFGLTTSDGGGNGCSWVKQIVHGKAPGSPMTPVTSAVTPDLWGQQHRRGDYGKHNTSSPF